MTKKSMWVLLLSGGVLGALLSTLAAAQERPSWIIVPQQSPPASAAAASNTTTNNTANNVVNGSAAVRARTVSAAGSIDTNVGSSAAVASPAAQAQPAVVFQHAPTKQQRAPFNPDADGGTAQRGLNPTPTADPATRRPVSATGSASSPAQFPRVSTAEQQTRDIERRRVLYDELMHERKLLADALGKKDAENAERRSTNIRSLMREIETVSSKTVAAAPTVAPTTARVAAKPASEESKRHAENMRVLQNAIASEASERESTLKKK